MLRVHFLNVGHGDCTIVQHPSGRLTMIDINNSQDYDSDSLAEYIAEHRAPTLGLLTPPPMSPLEQLYLMEQAKSELTDPIEFLQTNFPGQSLFRFILTHPDVDHMRGIKRLSETVGFHNFWDTSHTKAISDFRSDADEEDWNHYQSLRANAKHYRRGMAHFAYGRHDDGTAGGDNIEILSPTPELIDACNVSETSNDLSYVLRISHAGKSVIFPGDAEEQAWDDMHRVYGRHLRSDFLKASHHGRDSGYHLDALQMIRPAAIVVSVGRKPPTDASRKYAGQCNSVMSTRYYGDIRLDINDNGSHGWFVQRNGANP